MTSILLAILIAAALPLTARTVRKAVRGDFATDAVATLAIISAILLRDPIPGLVIVLMLTGGEALEHMARGRASRALKKLHDSAPRIAHLRNGTDYHDVPVDSVRVGELILVRPGEMVPVDGAVKTGTSHVNTAAITGEPVPRIARPGVELYSGMTNIEGPLEVVTSRIAAQSMYARIVDLVRSAEANKAPIQRLADRYAVWFTPIIMAIAALTFLLTRNPTLVLAVFVVATPCPLLLATPVAMLGGMNAAAKRSVIIRSGAALEQMSTTRAVVFDKTGTLTTGRPAAHEIIAEAGWEADQLLGLVAPLELGSGHVLAEAIVNVARAHDVPVQLAENVHEVAGSGVRGVVKGSEVAIGSHDFITHQLPGTTLPEPRQNRVNSYIAVNGAYAGRIEFEDQLRPDLARLFRHLEELGVSHKVILSGDAQETVSRVALELGVGEALGGLTPDQKLAALSEIMRGYGSTLMIGDGTNDAPALAAATTGLAVAQQTGGIATESADVVLLGDNLLRIADALRISQRAVRIAKQSIIAGLAASGLGVIAAAFGYLPPIAGAVLQEVIDLAVIVNALRAATLPAVKELVYS